MFRLSAISTLRSCACAALCAGMMILGTSVGRADDWDERVNPGSGTGRSDSGHNHSSGGDSNSRANSSEKKSYDFTLPYLEGEGSLTFKELAESDKPFVLIWWLSECPVCHLQLPYVQKLENLVEDGKADVRIVSINIDQGEDECREYVKEKGVSFEVLHDERCRRTDSQFKVQDMGTPVTYVFKPGGELVDYMSGWTSEFPSKVLKMLDLPVPDEARNN
ncbi:TlpA family protein disulfide reductase [bacterium]|nr:TlpA family protein disulfide reductase [bacterium]